jgi:hypothetical protein
MTDTPLQTIKLLLQAESGASRDCTVYFEPDGANHKLAPGETIRVEAVLPLGFEIEIAHSSESITLYAESTFGLRAWRANDDELEL